jgi:hypothetical protein
VQGHPVAPVVSELHADSQQSVGLGGASQPQSAIAVREPQARVSVLRSQATASRGGRTAPVRGSGRTQAASSAVLQPQLSAGCKRMHLADSRAATSVIRGQILILCGLLAVRDQGLAPCPCGEMHVPTAFAVEAAQAGPQSDAPRATLQGPSGVEQGSSEPDHVADAVPDGTANHPGCKPANSLSEEGGKQSHKTLKRRLQRLRKRVGAGSVGSDIGNTEGGEPPVEASQHVYVRSSGGMTAATEKREEAQACRPLPPLWVGTNHDVELESLTAVRTSGGGNPLGPQPAVDLPLPVADLGAGRHIVPVLRLGRPPVEARKAVALPQRPLPASVPAPYGAAPIAVSAGKAGANQASLPAHS